MGRRSLFLIGFAALLFIAVGCAAPNRLEKDFGNSVNQAKSNQILNPEAGQNIEPVSGLDGEAAQAILEKYRKDFEKPPAPLPYTLTIGTGGNK